MKISGGCAEESLDEVEEQSDIEADGDINSAMPPKSPMSLRHTVSQFMTIWNGPMADFYYAQQKALGHVVEGMRLCFRLRSQIRCLVNVFEAWGREAMVLPPSLVDFSESNQNTLHCATRPTQTKTHKNNHHNGQQMLQLSVCQKHTIPSGERHQIYILYILYIYIYIYIYDIYTVSYTYQTLQTIHCVSISVVVI